VEALAAHASTYPGEVRLEVQLSEEADGVDDEWSRGDVRAVPRGRRAVPRP